MFWEICSYINSVILGMEQAEYGKKILSTVSTKLVEITEKRTISRRNIWLQRRTSFLLFLPL